MSAFYSAQYRGVDGVGAGGFYIGNGIITGTDVSGAVYDGAYEQLGGRLVGEARLTTPYGGPLVTGKTLSHGESALVSFSLPTYFANGEEHPVSVDGINVNVVFTKIRDIP